MIEFIQFILAGFGVIWIAVTMSNVIHIREDLYRIAEALEKKDQ